MALQLSITTPDAIFLDKEVNYLYLPGSDGEIGILKEHTAFISVARAGELRYEGVDGLSESVAIGDGFVRVVDDKVMVVTEIALQIDDINESDYEAAIERAKQALAGEKRVDEEEAARIEASLSRDLTLLNLRRRQR